MRHRWKKHKERQININGNNIIHIYECKNCGLLKGEIFTSSRTLRRLYFRDTTILSYDRIPVGGCDINFKKIFFSKKDFEI